MRNACTALARRHPKDATVRLLAAEALLNLHPYDWWSPDGKPQPWTPAIEALLERSLALDPRLAGRAPLLDPPAGVFAAPAARPAPAPTSCAARYPAPGTCCTCPRTSTCGSGATTRPSGPTSARSKPTGADLAAGGRARRLPRRLRGAQPPLPLGRGVDGWPAGARAAGLDGRPGPRPAGPPAATRAPPSCSTYAGAALLHAGTLRPWAALLHDTPPPDRPGAYALALWHYARGTARVRALSRAAGKAGASATAAPGRRSGAAPWTAEEPQPGGAAAAYRQATLRSRHGAGRRPTAAGGGAAARSHWRSRTPWSTTNRHRGGAARASAGRSAAGAGQAADAEQVYREDLRHYPDNAGRSNGPARALSAQGRPGPADEAAASGPAPRSAGARRPAASRSVLPDRHRRWSHRRTNTIAPYRRGTAVINKSS